MALKPEKPTSLVANAAEAWSLTSPCWPRSE